VAKMFRHGKIPSQQRSEATIERAIELVTMCKLLVAMVPLRMGGRILPTFPIEPANCPDPSFTPDPKEFWHNFDKSLANLKLVPR